MDELLDMAAVRPPTLAHTVSKTPHPQRVRNMSPEQQQRLLQLMQDDLTTGAHHAQLYRLVCMHHVVHTAPIPAMDDAAPSDVAHFDWDIDGQNDNNNDDTGELDGEFDGELDSDTWKQLEEFELPEPIRQLFSETGILDSLPKGSQGPGEEVPVPWDSGYSSGGPLADDRRPQTMEEVDGEPAYVEEIDEDGLPWDGRRLAKQRAAEQRKERRMHTPVCRWHLCIRLVLLVAVYISSSFSFIVPLTTQLT